MPKRPGIATARTSGTFVNSYRKKSLAKKQKKAEEEEIIKRAKEEKIKVFEKVGLEIESDEETTEDENEDDGEVKDEIDNANNDQKNSTVVGNSSQDQETLKIDEDQEDGDDYDYEFTGDLHDYDDLFLVKPNTPIPNNDQRDQRDDTSFVDHDEQKVSTSNDLPVTEQNINSDDQGQNLPIRRTLYKSSDPRSTESNAIMKCPLCMEYKGIIYLFTNKESLRLHLASEHEFSYLCFQNIFNNNDQ